MSFFTKSIFSILTISVVVFSATFSAPAQRAKPAAAKPAALRTVTIATEPKAVVWVDDVKRGVTNEQGNLAGVKLGPRSKVLRVRADGFKQSLTTLTVATKGIVRVKLVETSDRAELLFQNAERLRENPLGEEDRRKAVEMYNEAAKLRPNFPEVYLGLARVNFDLKDLDGVYDAVKLGRKYRPIYPELTTVEGRAYHEDIEDDLAIKAYQRAIKEGGGNQPEAYTGMAIIYREQENYEEAIKAFKMAIAQLFDTEPVIYQLLGDLLEKTRRFKEAIAIYEQYLKAAPDSPDAEGIRSMMDQLKIQLEEEDQP